MKYLRFTDDEVDASNLNRTYAENESLRNVCLSQPEFSGMESNNAIQFNLDGRPTFSFSQPAHVEDLLLGTQLQAFTQPSQVYILLHEFFQLMCCYFEKNIFITLCSACSKTPSKD